jgi:hypothetical protein
MDQFGEETMRWHGRPGGCTILCALCQNAEATLQCTECMHSIDLCQGCMVRKHSLRPLHCIKVCAQAHRLFHELMALKEWRDGFWSQTSLRSLGVHIQLGHGLGGDCLAYGEAIPHFTVMHTNGIHVVNLRFCACHGAPSKHVQLLCSQWWPATTAQPRTAATVELLQTFRALNLQARANATDVYCLLELLSNEDGEEELPVSTSIQLLHPSSHQQCTQDHLHEFCLMVYAWRVVALFKEGGRFMALNGQQDTGPGGLALSCCACPLPGTNMPLDWQKDVSKP